MNVRAMSRRSLLVGCGAISLSGIARANEARLELQAGDPEAEPETVPIYEDLIAAMSTAQTRAQFNERLADFPEALLQTATEFLGFNRAQNESEISEFLYLFNLGFRQPNGNYTAFCASGLSYAAALAYTKTLFPIKRRTELSNLKRLLPEVGRYHFFPTPSVVNMYHVALGTRRWRERDVAPKPGWAVVFDWRQKNTCFSADHVGVVEAVSADGTQLTTIEFNTANSDGGVGAQTNGGSVARRKRTIDGRIKGYIDTGALNPFW